MTIHDPFCTLLPTTEHATPPPLLPRPWQSSKLQRRAPAHGTSIASASVLRR
eukprot:COSAG01_NODE_7819_length_3043_cov_2.192595_1_plen_51_part_10